MSSVTDRLRPPRRVREAVRNLDPTRVLNGEVSPKEYFGIDLNPGDFKSVTENAYEKAKEYSNSERENKNYCDCVTVVAAGCVVGGAMLGGAVGAGLGAVGGFPAARLACGRFYSSGPCE